jgi:primosomal replication protein N
VNRVFLAGRLKTKPEVVYTPKGKKFVLFPLWVDEGDFRIDVECTGERDTAHLSDKVGKELMVSGMLIKTKTKSRDVFTLKAHKIYWMEE